MARLFRGTVRCSHRTLAEYLDAFLDAEWQLAQLADVPDVAQAPRFLVLAFDKP